MRQTLIASAAITLMIVGTGVTFAEESNGAAPPSTAPSDTRRDIDKAVLLGSDVFSQDQILMGQVDRVVMEPNGRLQAILVKTGGFLGFGTRLVAIPENAFHMRGRNVQLQLTSDEVQKMPEQRDNS